MLVAMQRSVSVLVRSGLLQQGAAPLRAVQTLVREEPAQGSAEWEAARPYSEIPGPAPLPLIGNAWRFMPGIGTLPIHDFTLMMKHMLANYGPVSKVVNIPGKRDMVFLFNPQDFEVMFRHEGQWPERLVFDSFPYYRNETRKDFFQGIGGILSVNGEPWQQFRTFVNPVMMQPRNSRMYAPKIDQVAHDFLSLIPGMLDSNKETPVHFIKDIQRWALESISLVALDTRLGCLEPNLGENSEPHRMITAADEIFDLLFHLDMGFPLWKFVTTPSWKKYVKNLDFFTGVCEQHITRAQEKFKTEKLGEAESSVLQKLLERDPNPKKAVVMAMDMMLAGIDTTSYTVAGVLYHLAQNPAAQERLFEEVRAHLPRQDSPLTADILEELKFLRACIKENNRLNPVALGTGRCTPVDVVIGNYQIPKGTDVLMCHALSTLQAEQFPEPTRFLPERWLKSECPFPDKRAHPFSFMPFGFGKRNCVGMRFAMLEIETLVARMVRSYRMEWHHGPMKFTSRALYAPADPIRLRLFPRPE